MHVLSMANFVSMASYVLLQNKLMSNATAHARNCTLRSIGIKFPLLGHSKSIRFLPVSIPSVPTQYKNIAANCPETGRTVLKRLLHGYIMLLSRRERGLATAILSCVPSKLKFKSDSGCN